MATSSSDHGSHGGDSTREQPRVGNETLGIQTIESNPAEGPLSIGDENPVVEETNKGDTVGGIEVSKEAEEGRDRLAPEVNLVVLSSTEAMVTGGGTGVDFRAETTTRGGSGDADRSGGDMHEDQGNHDDGGDGGSEAIHRNLANGKQPTETGGSERRKLGEPIVDPSTVAFIAPMGSSAQQRMYYADFTDFIREEQLARLGQMNKALLEAILQMQQEHVENRARRDKEIRLAMEHEAEVMWQENTERKR